MDTVGADALNWIVNFIVTILPYFIPIILGYFAVFFWHHYVNEQFIEGVEWVLLEIKVPREVTKTPLAMELIFTNAFYHLSGKGFWETHWQGAVHFWFSLELVSLGGNVHFFIRTPSRIKDLIETQVYAQYPQAEISEAKDYTNYITATAPDDKWNLWGCEFNLLKEDPLPIRTYVDYGLDKAGDEENEKVDPITPAIEFLGSIKKDEQVWIQIIVRPSKKDYHTHGTAFKHHKFNEEAMIFLNKLLLPYTKKSVNADGTKASEIRAPKHFDDLVEGIRGKMSKIAFDVGIRCIYLAPTPIFDQNQRRALRLIWRQYASPYANEFNRIHSTQFDTPWVDPKGWRLQRMKNRMLFRYRTRLMFHPPVWQSFKYPWPFKVIFDSHNPKPFVLNTEELATIFHFPGMVSETPSFKRIESKTSKPPFNLPT